MDSQNLRVVRDLWDAFETQGAIAGLEKLLEHCDEDVEFRPYAANGTVLRGAEEIRAFFRERQSAGEKLHARPWSFEEHGDCVEVAGSIRLIRADGSLADAQVRWSYAFKDGRVIRAATAPLSAPLPS